jgi:hypothetical protein
VGDLHGASCLREHGQRKKRRRSNHDRFMSRINQTEPNLSLMTFICLPAISVHSIISDQLRSICGFGDGANFYFVYVKTMVFCKAKLCVCQSKLCILCKLNNKHLPETSFNWTIGVKSANVSDK